jgi:tetratricopeptide (TPR) repeat protein
MADEGRAMAEVTLLRCELDLGHYDAAIEAYERARPTVDRLLDLHWYLWSRTGALWAYAYQGRWAESRALADEALRVGEELDDRGMQSHILLNVAIISMDQGDPDRAALEVQRAVELAQAPSDRLMAEATAGWVACCLGQDDAGSAAHQQAIAAQEQAAAALDAGGLVPAAINIGVALGEALLVSGQTERARTVLIAYGQRAERAGMRFQQARAERLLGEIAFAASTGPAELGAAASHLERSIRLFTDLGAENDLALARAAYGRLLARRGQPDAAREHVDWALTTLTRLGTRDARQFGQFGLGALPRTVVDV